MFHHQTWPESTSYNLAVALDIESGLTPEGLDAAVQALVRRYPMLTARFGMDDAEYVQSIDPGRTLHIEHRDAEPLSEPALLEVLQAEVTRPFALLREPGLRAIVFRGRAGRLTLLLCVHHILTDGSSQLRLVQDLCTLLAGGALPSLPTSSYLEFVLWQQAYLRGARAAADLAYWQAELGGELPVLGLPTDRPRALVRSESGDELPFLIGREETAALTSLARAEGATLGSVLLASWLVLLHRYSGQEEVICGTPYFGRDESRFAQVFGYFVNMLPLRIRLGRRQTFVEVVRQVHARLLGAIEHASYPFSRLVQALHAKSDLGRPPLFQNSLAFDNLPDKALVAAFCSAAASPAMQLSNLKIRPIPLKQQAGHFELGCQCIESDERIVGVVSYSQALYNRSTVERLTAHFEQLIRSACRSPSLRIGELPLLSAVERQLILVEWNQTVRDVPRDRCLHELFAEQAAQTPDALALSCGEERLSYRELDARANQLAHHLRALGVGSEILVGVWIERSVELIVAILGILKAGGAYVPLDVHAPRQRLRDMTIDARLHSIIGAGDTTRLDWAAGLSHVQLVALSDARVRDSLALFPREHAPSLGAQRPSSLAYVIYTSGSTGQPKGVAIEHRSVVNLLSDLPVRAGAWSAQKIALLASVIFDGSVKQIFGALLRGHSLHLVNEEARRDGESLLRLLREQAIEVADCTPTLLQILVAAGLPEADGLALQELLCGGEPLPVALLRALYRDEKRRGLRVINLYGPTECCVDTTAYEVDADHLPEGEATPLGRPLPNMEVYILDEDLAPVPIGVVGELCIGGVGVGRGYLGRPALTAEKFVPHPFSQREGARLYRSGDLARYRADGVIEYLGRKDQQVKLRGYRIELGEIEAVLREQPNVRDCVVVLREDQPGDPRLVAYLLQDPEGTRTNDTLRAQLAERLPEYMVPKQLVTLDEFPLTASGKLDKQALPAPAREAAAASFVAPRTPREATLAAIFCRVLRVDRVGIHDDFFALGGHSLLAVQLMHLASAAGVPLTVRDIFLHPTVADLAQVRAVDRPDPMDRAERPQSCLVSLREGAAAGAVLLIPGAGGTLYAMGMLARALSIDSPVWGLTTPPLAGTGAMPGSLRELCAQYVEEVRRLPAARPLRLIGHSFGGSVALELSAQLAAAGIPVESIFLLDAWAPDQRGPSNRAALLLQLAMALELPIAPAVLSSFSENEAMARVAAALQARDLGGDDPQAFLCTTLEHALSSVAMLADWTPPRPPSPVHLLLAAQSPADAPPDRGWRRFLPIASSSYIDGDHYSLLRPPHVDGTARAIAKLLEQR